MTEQTPHTTRIQVNDVEVSVDFLDGKSARKGISPQLGKRFECALPVDIKTKNDKGVEVTETHHLKGVFESSEGPVEMGCGAEVLCIKPSSTQDVLLHCGMPMSLLQPKVLPSAD